MSGIHLNHHFCWDEVLELCYVYEDPGLMLPVCECGKIQASEKKVQHKITNRKYLDDKICSGKDCKIVGERIFRKNEKKRWIQIPGRIFGFNNVGEGSNVADKFCKVIKEFSETERRKIKERNIFEPMEEVENYCDGIEERLKAEGKWPEGHDWSSCSCKLFSTLIEAGDSATLLSMPNQKIEQVLQCQHGGQAVGNNFRFLIYHLMNTYFCTNLIFAANLQDKPDQWGPMKPGSYNRGFLMHDCDGQTFLFGCRKYLTDEVYMKDFDGMKELCKTIFRFLYILDMLRVEVDPKNDEMENRKSYFF